MTVMALGKALKLYNDCVIDLIEDITLEIVDVFPDLSKAFETVDH